MVESENSFQARWCDRMFLILYLWTATCQRKKTWTWASCDGNSCSHHNRSCDESSTEGERQKRCQPAWRRGFSQWVPLRWSSSGRHQSGLDQKPETTPPTAHFIFTPSHTFSRGGTFELFVGWPWQCEWRSCTAIIATERLLRVIFLIPLSVWFGLIWNVLCILMEQRHCSTFSKAVNLISSTLHFLTRNLCLFLFTEIITIHSNRISTRSYSEKVCKSKCRNWILNY